MHLNEKAMGPLWQCFKIDRKWVREKEQKKGGLSQKKAKLRRGKLQMSRIIHGKTSAEMNE